MPLKQQTLAGPVANPREEFGGEGNLLRGGQAVDTARNQRLVRLPVFRRPEDSRTRGRKEREREGVGLRAGEAELEREGGKEGKRQGKRKTESSNDTLF